MERPLHSPTDALGRDTGFALDEGYAVAYAYDMFGRFHSVSSSVQSAQSVATYSRLADTDLLEATSFTVGSSAFDVRRSYEPGRSLVTAVSNSFDSALVSAYGYENNELGQRTHIERSGMSFGGLPVRDAYEYNPRSEVTSARRTPVGSQTELRGFSYDYDYDAIGNRITSTEYDHEGNALESEYTANALNQYGQRTVPGYAGVRGEADTNATVTVNADPAWRWGEYFYGGDEADNSSDAVMKELEITATHSNLFTSVTGRVFVAETPESFEYDDDGNLTQDGRFTYDWDAENRLIGVTTRDDLPTGVPRVKVDYLYDHQSRRIAAATAVWTNDAWQAVESRAFIYDGWNVIRETVAGGSGSPQTVSTNLYTWGLDLSGSLQGAGGIGGLLAASMGGTTVLYCYDANGNVGQLVSTDGELLAHYEYSPFGETIVSTGPLVKANPFQFSTKHWNDLTGLGYWGYRWYSPGMGRWPSRDPKNEGALRSVSTPGKALAYSLIVNPRHEMLSNRFVANEPLGKTDLLGLEVIVERIDVPSEFSHPNNEVGYTIWGKSEIEMTVKRDVSCAPNGCWRLVLVSDSTKIQWWATPQEHIVEHEMRHVEDNKYYHERVVSYAESKAGCYKSEQAAACWKHVASIEMPSMTFWRGLVTSQIVRDGWSPDEYRQKLDLARDKFDRAVRKCTQM